MAGSAVFAMGSTSVSNTSPAPPAWSTGSAILNWTLLGGWTAGLWFVSVTAVTAGPGTLFSGVSIGLAPIAPDTGEWVDVYSPTTSTYLRTDGGLVVITNSLPPMNYGLVVPLNGNAYQLVLYGNPGTTATISSSLIVHD